MNKILENAKAVASFATALGAALLAQYGPDGTIGAVSTAVVVVGGVIVTWAVPNKPSV